MSYNPGFTDVTATISIAANATSSGACTSIGGAGTFTVQLTGTFTATVQIQVTRDGSTWVNLTGSTSVVNAATSAFVASGNMTATGVYQADISGFAGARVITTAYTSGTVTGTAAISQNNGIASVEGTVTVAGTVGVTGYPSAAASADALANPTVTQIGAADLRYNGASWDRARNSINLTVGDTGAKTATFNGATITNYNGVGGLITCIVSTVSGTSPTMTLQLQWSPDGGTTWLNYGPATATLTAAGQVTIGCFPSQWEDASSTTLAAFTTGSTVSKFINAPLPRTFRVVYTIGGTTPSFTLTNTYFNSIAS